MAAVKTPTSLWSYWRLRLQVLNQHKIHAGLPREHPESYHSFMWNNFFRHIDITPENTHILDGNAADLEEECKAFERKITDAGGIKLFVGGQEAITCLCFFFTFAFRLALQTIFRVTFSRTPLSYVRYRSRWPHCLQRARFQLSFQDPREDPGKGNHHCKCTILWWRSLQGAHHGAHCGSGHRHGCRRGQNLSLDRPKVFLCLCVLLVT